MAELHGKIGALYAQSGSATTITTGPIGTGDDVTTAFYCIEPVNTCDATTNWTGTSLSLDGADLKEGTNSLVDTVGTAVATTEYKTTQTPASNPDWSKRARVSLWVKSDRASTAFTFCRFNITDADGNVSYWNLTFSATTWTRFNLTLSSPDGNSGTAADLTDINTYEVDFKAADTTGFYKKLDWIGVTPNMARSVTLYVAGTAQGQEQYIVTPSGRVTLGTAPTAGQAITCTYSYYTVAQVGGFTGWTADDVCDASEVTDFGDSGHRTYIAGLTGWSGSADRHWISDEIISTWLGTEMIVKLYVDTSSSPMVRYEGWAIITGLHTNVAVDAVETEPIDMQGCGVLSNEVL